MTAATAQRLSVADVEALDPYVLMAVLGKRVIHPGGRRTTEELLQRANIQPEHRVLDVGCGVGTTAIEVASRFGAHVTAVDVSSVMLERAQANVQRAGLTEKIDVEYGDITAMQFPDNTFDRVIAEAVTMFVDRSSAASELVRVCRPGGQVLATEFLWRKPPTPEARQIFLGEVCPGMNFDTMDEWVQIYSNAGLSQVDVASGPFDMMTPTGFLKDEGLANALAFMGRACTRLVYLRRLIWLMPRMQRAVPYLGYLVVTGTKPA